MQHNLSQIALILGISVQAVAKHKNGLIKDGYIRKIPGRPFWDRGKNWKFIEKIALKKGLNDNGQGVKPPNDPRLVETFLTPTAEMHLHGGMMFLVEKVGDLQEFEYRPNDGPNCFVSLLEPEPFNTHRNNEMYNGKLWMPRNTYGSSVKYHHTPNADWFYLWPPRAELTKEEINELMEEEQENRGSSYPHRFFEEDVYDIMNFLEKWAGWKFKRGPGQSRPIGKITGPVLYGYSGDHIETMVPEGLKGFTDLPKAHIDKSPGDYEVEFEKIKDIHAVMSAGDKFDALEKKNDMLEQKHDEVKAALMRVYDLLAEVVQYQELEMQSQRARVLEDKLRKADEERKQKTLDDHRGYG